mmetsp:Transcript_9032/g.36931  ORF Transcript_9032/g.36931 Transcript_9032/m.36931 type:complete len:327 (+) Transcript_9032:105-1085(+)
MGNSLRDHHVLGVLKLPRVKLSLQHVINPLLRPFRQLLVVRSVPFPHGRADVQLELVKVGLRRELEPPRLPLPAVRLPFPSLRPLLLLQHVLHLLCGGVVTFLQRHAIGAEARVGLEQTLGRILCRVHAKRPVVKPIFLDERTLLGVRVLGPEDATGGTVGLGGGHRLVPLALELELALAICAEDVARHFPSARAEHVTLLERQHGAGARLEVVHAHLAEGIDPQPTDHEIVHPGCRRQQVVHVPALLQVDPCPPFGPDVDPVTHELGPNRGGQVKRPARGLAVARSDRGVMAHLLGDVDPVHLGQRHLPGLAKNGVERLLRALVG